jgi:hypothetical protein
MRKAYRNATSDAKRREIAEGYEARHGITNVHDSRHAAWYAQETRAAGSRGTEACPVLDEDAEHECALQIALDILARDEEFGLSATTRRAHTGR